MDKGTKSGKERKKDRKREEKERKKQWSILEQEKICR